MDLPHNILLYLLLLIALALGYLFGRRERRRLRPQNVVIKDYYQGLNFLLGERPELGIDRFIEAMAVSDDTIDVHLALAGVVRRRGEVDKAIRIHQNLLASPVINTANKQLVEFELARDYHVAGLLGRAEGLLVEIVQRRDGQHKAAVELLLDLYEQEKEWQKAIDVSAKLVAGDQQLRRRICHLHCELAQLCLHEGDIPGSRTHIRRATALDPNQPRAHALAASLELKLKRYKRAVRLLTRAVEIQPGLIVEYLPWFALAYENLESDGDFEKLLRKAAREQPNPQVLRSLIALQQKNGGQLDREQILTSIALAPGVGHISLLLEMLSRDPQDNEVVHKLLGQIASQDLHYQCGNCGFRSQEHSWHCPTCKNWGTFSPQ